MTLDDDRPPPWRRYLRLARENPARDVDDELSFHLQSTIDELLAAGMTLDGACAAARAKFGDVEGISKTLYSLSQQRERHMTRAEWMDALKQDVAFGLRQLKKAPGFTCIALITLALGIGANAAIFSVVNTVLLRPLPFANTDRVLRLSQRNGNDEMWSVPFGNYDTWRREASGFEEIGALFGGGRRTLTGHGDPTPILTYNASAGYWKVLKINPVVGRYFTEAEDRDGGPQVVVLSEALWRNRFGGARDILGRSITLSGQSYQVIGVAPSQYLLQPPDEAAWVPLAASAARLSDFGDHELRVYGLVKRGVAPTAAVAQLQQIDTRLAHEHPHSFYDGGIIARTLEDALFGDYRKSLYLLMGAVAVVLLIACANIANLLLARATVRRTEIAVRGALGASRRRIIAQLLVESVLLAIGGAVLGLAVAYAGTRFLVSSPLPVPRLHDARLDWPVVLFTLGLAVFCAIVFGLIPAIRAARLDLQQTLRDGGRESRGGGNYRVRHALVIAQLCLTQVLLVGAGLLIRSAIAVNAVDVGFNTKNLLLFSTGLPSARYDGPERLEAGLEQLTAGIGAIPGVRGVTWTQTAPIYGGGWNWTAKREGSDGHDAGAVVADMRFVSPAYFTTLELPVLRGRSFTAADGAKAPLVAIVSRGLADKLWPGQDPVGRRISNGGDRWREVVGLAADVHSNGPQNAVPEVMYMPAAQSGNSGVTFIVRGGVPVTTLMPAIRNAVKSVDPLLAISGVSTMDEAVGNLFALDRFMRWLLTLLGATGLVLAVVGIYGVISYFVTQRHHEMGVRIALGASGASVHWLVVRQGLVLTAIGILVGVPAALAATRLLQSFVFGVTVRDPATFVIVAGLLAVVAIVAGYIPARRATRIDPLEALRAS
ncbi:MAG TPA: ABC transporter permease [Gemmatimonadaceae bacterium]|nr:ABC transporter permease [Gemmatimonadaceae bacterium]